ncbi:MAG: SDR family NAD(P)-dependent oxidoreductase [Alteripontixanthobacter sp.]
MSEFGAKSTTDDVLEGHDLSGRSYFITGGNSGLGQETARALASKGAHVILAGRDETALEASREEILGSVGDAQVDTIICDLASIDSVRKCGAQARERFERIDVLINNAGVMACPFGHTSDGFERQFGTNHIGHFVLTNELLPLVEKGRDARIVNLSSLAHHRSGVDFDDPNFEKREYDKQVAYGQSKTANALHAVALNTRLSAKGIEAFSVHPGGIMTNLGRHLTEADIAAMMKRLNEMGDGGFEFKTIPQGAATSAWAATAPDLAGQGGAYLENCQIAEVSEETQASGVRPYAIDPQLAERLWDESERMVAAA